MSAPDLPRITAWEPGPVRGGVAVLAGVAERLPGWRIRLEAVGRQLQAASCWSGPAADSAAEVVVDLSTAATAVGAAWEVSLAAFHLLVGWTGSAQTLAIEAQACAARAGCALTAGGALEAPATAAVRAMAPDQFQIVAERAGTAARAEALAAEALHLGSLAAAAADQADDALRTVGVVGARSPATFTDLSITVGPADRTPGLPAGRSPAEVAAWWARLPAATQLDAVAAEPAEIGRLGGIPAWARDRANRLLLDRALAAPGAPGHATAVAVAAQLAAAEAGDRPVQLYAFEPAAGRAAVAIGDLDSADAVGVLVPGMGTTVAGDLGGLVTSAEGVADAARAAAPGLAVATLAWIGYRAPQGFAEAASRRYARRGGPALATDLAGLAGSRAATGHLPARTTVLAHSYGTVVVDAAADGPGLLAADAVVLLGSPGMEDDGALRQEAPELYDAVGGQDPIAISGWFGDNPWEGKYGATLLPTELDQTHGDYYDPGYPTLAALGAVVAGTERPR